MEISEIKELMRVRRITQKDLSQMSNIPLQTIRKIFAGYTSHPRIDTMKAIEKALGIDNAQSYTQQGELKGTSTRSLTDNEKALLDAFNSLIPPLQEYALQMVVGLTKQSQVINSKKA